MECLFIGENPRLEAIREGHGERCAVIAHPHPLYGGDMQNNAVTTARDAVLGRGFSSLRFNFRGVGRSEGIHDEGRGEVRDLEVALAAAGQNPVLIGYSFGAWVAAALTAKSPLPTILIAPPTAMFAFPDLKGREVWVVVGSADQFCDHEALRSKVDPERLMIAKGIDHFWFGHEKALLSYLDVFLGDVK